MQVMLRDGEAFEQMLRRFHVGVLKEGILLEYKLHATFVSQGEQRREAARRARRKQRRKLLRQQQRDAKAS